MQPSSLTNHQWSIKAHLVIPDPCQLPLEFIDGTRRDTIFSHMFHLSITRSEKKYFLKSVVQRCFISLTLWPLVDKFRLLSNNESKLGRDFPLSILNISSKSALLRLSSRVQRPSCRRRSLYGRTFIPGTILVKRCCTLSNNCLSLDRARIVEFFFDRYIATKSTTISR